MRLAAYVQHAHSSEFVQRLARLAVSWGCAACVFVRERGTTEARNRDPVFIAFRMMTLFHLCPLSCLLLEREKAPPGVAAEAVSRRTGRRKEEGTH